MEGLLFRPCRSILRCAAHRHGAYLGIGDFTKLVSKARDRKIQAQMLFQDVDAESIEALKIEHITACTDNAPESFLDELHSWLRDICQHQLGFLALVEAARNAITNLNMMFLMPENYFEPHCVHG